MIPSPWEVIVLKPTAVFQSFLAAHLPADKVPSLTILQTDTTAFAIQRQTDDEATLDEIERLYPVMFRHEICRWLGEHAQNEIEVSFLDFLCSFKFELHHHLVLLEDEFKDAHQMLRIKPKALLLKWMQAQVGEDKELATIVEQATVTHLAENATVIVKNFQHLGDIKSFLKLHFPILFEAEMQRMCEDRQQWPVIESYADFCRYFAFDIHTQLIHLH